MGKSKLVPELRFPEFEKDGEWEERKISEIGETINGLTGKSGNDFGQGSPFVTYKQVFYNSFIDLKSCGKVTVGENEKQNMIERGDILFTTSSETADEVGFASVLIDTPTEPTYLNSFCFSLRPYDLDEIQPQFARYLFHSPLYRKSITALAQGITRYNISKGPFLALKLGLPKLAEQQKIASCLSSLDEVIAAHTEKLDLLKEHKKGLMQNLFPQEGEKVPKFRFPEFTNGIEWVKKELKHICKINQGLQIAISERYTERGEGRHFYITNEFLKKGSNLKYYVENPPQSVLCVESDILMTRTGNTGKVVTGVKGAFHNNFFKINFDRNIMNEGFLYEFLSHERTQSTILKYAGTSTIPDLNHGDFYKIEIMFPSINEQQRISDCLSSLKNLIAIQTEKIDQLKLHKKGLMQRLFPQMTN